MADASIEVSERAAALRDQIEQHNYCYYVLDDPQVSDLEYDQLMAELQAIEKKYPELVSPASPTQRVGSAPLSEFAQSRHRLPMLSLANAFEFQDVVEFDRRLRQALAIEQAEYVGEPKLDGVSINLHYHRGQLIEAATRGDGEVGENITANARTIGTVPLTLRCSTPPEHIEIRGEVVIRHKDFERLNR